MVSCAVYERMRSTGITKLRGCMYVHRNGDAYDAEKAAIVVVHVCVNHPCT
jgi:hypothetical protein